MTASPTRLAFIGLGVMGEPICRNLKQGSGATVIALDRDPAPLQRLAAHGVQVATTVREAVTGAQVVFLSLPSGEVVRSLCEEPEGLLAVTQPGQIVVDTGTSPVQLTRDLATAFAKQGVTFVDAPVARTRAAAEAGKLAVMVGADPAVFERLRPLVATFATDITLCGPIGCGQVVKILNNMVLFETVQAIAEAHAIGTHAGVDPTLLFDALSKGSGDSFALRNHGMKAILPGEYPERAFSVVYARKDLRYALQLARDAGIEAPGAQSVAGRFDAAIAAGLGEQYWPVIRRLLDR